MYIANVLYNVLYDTLDNIHNTYTEKYYNLIKSFYVR